MNKGNIMKIQIMIILATFMLLASCKNAAKQNQIVIVSLDTLVEKVGDYVDKQVTIEGKIVHICGVDGKKMKLRNENGVIVKIEAGDTFEKFDKAFNGKELKITGVVKESRTGKEYISEIEKKRTILCHIDNTPCKDKEWIVKRQEEGTAENISKNYTDKLRDKMNETNRNYVSVVSIIAEKIEEIIETEENRK